MIEEDYRYTIGKHVAITAGAGTGKTYTLSRRYINALLGFDFFTLMQRESSFTVDLSLADSTSAKPTEIVTTTFTEAGAMEMRGRIEWLIALMLRIIEDSTLELKDTEEEDIRNLVLLLDDEQKIYVKEKLEFASTTVYLSVISTIHSFAISIINKNTELVPMDTTIDVLDDTQKNDVFEKLWFEVSNEYQDIYLQIDQDYSLFNAKDFTKRYVFDRRIRDGFNSFVENLDENSDLTEIYLKLFFEENIQKILDAFVEYEMNYNNYQEKVDANILKWEEKNKDDINFNYKDHFNTFLKKIFLLKATKLPDIRYTQSGLYTKINKIFEDIFPFTKEEDFFILIKKMHTILSSLREKYVARLQKDAKLDFDRILEVASDLLDNEKASINIYKYFFVDEFQDTNYFQWDIIKKAANLRSENCANIFLVGDEKQSIFEFQGAEVSTFQVAIEEIISLKGEGSIVQPRMSKNYRSDKGILDFVNNTFKNIMSKKGNVIPEKVTFLNPVINRFVDKVYDKYLESQDSLSKECEVDYSPLEANALEQGTVKVLVKTIQLSEEARLAKVKLKEYSADCRAEHEAYMIADFISKIKDGRQSEYTDIKEKLDTNKKAIVLLCDAKANMLKLKEALKKVGLDSKVSASEDFYKTGEVIEIYHILAMIKNLKNNSNMYIKNNPDNNSDIAKQNNKNKQTRFFLAGGMRTKVFRYDDRDILEYINNNKIPQVIKELVELYNVLSLGDLLAYIVENYEVKRIYAHLDGYPQVKANLKKIIREASSFVATIGTPLDEFVDMLQSACLEDDISKEDQEFYESEQTNSIEIRTMHSSKGLSWPMVIIPELGRSLKGKTNTLKYGTYKTQESNLSIVGFSINGAKTIASSTAHIISEKKKYAEKKRLLYVAMTRPENHLVLSTATSKDKNIFETNSYWFRWLNLDIDDGNNLVTTDILENDMVDKIHSFISSDKLSVEVYEKTLDGLEDTPVCDVESIPMVEHILEIRNNHIATLREECRELKINNPFQFSKAASFGIAAHLLLELGFKDAIFATPRESDYIEKFIENQNVEDKERLLKVVENFKGSDIFEDLHNSELVLFEEEFNFFDEETNTPQKRFIDLLYFKDEKWNIIDFKSNSLTKSRSKEKIIEEHEYEAQLEGYFNYIASRYGSENISLCSILWLDDGTLSDLKPVSVEKNKGEV